LYLLEPHHSKLALSHTISRSPWRPGKCRHSSVGQLSAVSPHPIPLQEGSKWHPGSHYVGASQWPRGRRAVRRLHLQAAALRRVYKTTKTPARSVIVASISFQNRTTMYPTSTAPEHRSCGGTAEEPGTHRTLADSRSRADRGHVVDKRKARRRSARRASRSPSACRHGTQGRGPGSRSGADRARERTAHRSLVSI